MQDAFSLRQRLIQASGQTRLDILAGLVASGDESAFESIYLETVDSVYGYLRGQCRNDATAEDLVANVYLKAWKSAASYRQGSNNYQRWLFTIARNELVDHWRRNREVSPFDDLNFADSGTVPMDDAMGEDYSAISEALGRLNAEQREVVILRFFNELSHAEIARILGKREGAVRAQLLRALRQMRKAISNVAT
ncbi:MAG: RNA polymerase sigma factor [Dehalococcoidia bacterium]